LGGKICIAAFFAGRDIKSISNQSTTAKFYMLGVKDFNFVKDLREEF
jgi:hypothetical protein